MPPPTPHKVLFAGSLLVNELVSWVDIVVFAKLVLEGFFDACIESNMISLDLSEKPRKPMVMDVREDKLIEQVTFRGERKKESWICCSICWKRVRRSKVAQRTLQKCWNASLPCNNSNESMSIAETVSLVLCWRCFAISLTHYCLLKLVRSKDETRQEKKATRQPRDNHTTITKKESHNHKKRKSQDKRMQERTRLDKTSKQDKTRQDYDKLDKTRKIRQERQDKSK